MQSDNNDIFLESFRKYASCEKKSGSICILGQPIYICISVTAESRAFKITAFYLGKHIATYKINLSSYLHRTRWNAFC